MATLGESRLAVAGARSAAADPLSWPDRFAGLQIAVVQILMPTAGVPIVDVARWACLFFGLVTALLLGFVLRGLTVSVTATAAGVLAAGATLPALVLHSGISAAAPAAAWLTAAAALAVHGRARAALATAVVAVLTAPLAGAAVLALVAHLVLGGLVRRTVRVRTPLGVTAGIAALAVAALSAGAGPLAGAAGPEVSTPVAAAVAATGALLAATAGRFARWLRPALTGTVPLLVVALVPGPGRAAALLLAAPVLAVAFAVVVEQLVERYARRSVTGPLLLGLALVIGPAVAVAATAPAPPARDPALLGWLASAIGPDTVVRADPLDRAELLAAGFPAARLRAADAPPVAGEVVLDTDRSPGGPASCPADATIAVTARGTGGGGAVVCRTDGDGPAVAAEAPARARFGTTLAGNPALALTPGAADALRSGSVDPRLMLVLAAMTTAHRVSVADFPAAPLDAPAVPRRQMLLSQVDGTLPASSELLRTWLSGQQPPYVPSSVDPVGAALLVGWPAPTPSGLLPPS